MYKSLKQHFNQTKIAFLKNKRDNFLGWKQRSFQFTLNIILLHPCTINLKTYNLIVLCSYVSYKLHNYSYNYIT